MSDAFYRLVRTIGYGPWRASARPVLLNRARTMRHGAYILAANHCCPYDIPALVAHCHRPLDFLSIVEVFEYPVLAWFYGSMNAFPLDRSRPDPGTQRTILRRLRAGRVIALFPEGGFRSGEASVLQGGAIRPGLGRLSLMSQAPVIPCAIIGTEQYRRWTAWMPLMRTGYGLAFGAAMPPPAGKGSVDAFENAYRRNMVALGAELVEAMHRHVRPR